MADATFYIVSKPDPKNRVQIEVGDSKQVGFYPQVKMMRWDNEVNFSVRLVTNETLSSPTQNIESKISCDGIKSSISFYQVTDGYEFDITLKEKPSSNVFQFTLESKNLVAYFQPPLNKIWKPGQCGCETFTETEGFDKDGKRIAYRPERVVGSYALYHSSVPITYTNGKLYRTGKFGHIYRPQVKDSTGKKVWGDLLVDIESGILTVTLPQDFLDNAAYPVTESAGLVIGNETIQATEQTTSSLCGFFASPGTGTVETISTAVGGWAGSANFNAGIYNGTSGDITTNVGHGTSASKVFTVAADWIDVTTSISVSDSTNYWLVPELNGSLYFYYDSGTGNVAIGAPTYDTWGSNPTAYDGNYYGSIITSIHGNFAAAAATIELEGYRFRNDDGSESAATWKANQDTNITLAADTAARLRALLNATGDPASIGAQLEYRYKPSGGAFGSWTKVN